MQEVRSYEDVMERLSDGELAHLTAVFKKRLADGESLDDILPEVFAAVCEADRRILGMAPFDVQIMGGIALHQGCLAEMNTGEGKTLVATMPLYLNALTGKSTILVTANEYLAARDAEEMGQVYQFMGLSVAAGVSLKPGVNFTNAEKKEIYAADIVYTTHGALGFDYLLDNLVTSARDRFLRPFYYVIIDEADAVLLDGAQTPLVIAASPRVQSNLYQVADFFVTTLKEGIDYEQEENKVWLTEAGIRYAETFFQIDNFYSRRFFEINRHVTLALRAHVLFREGREYMVLQKSDRELVLLDNGSGRLMHGVKLRGGQHQALEVKEKLELSQENRSVAAITFQNLFRLFPKMAGMSGTLADAAEEFRDVYGVRVLVIPPNRPMKRKDLPDLYYQNADRQFQAAVLTALEIHWTGRPVLIVTSTIEETELISESLTKNKVPHNVLNAGNAVWEAEIIKEAGRKNAVTVATSMAGRGTDIKLGKGVDKLGGLAVIGVGRMENTRQERQARGRAGRQGDAGTSRFFVSLQDRVVKENGPEHLDKYIEGRKLGRGKLKRLVSQAQSMGEERAVLSRRRAMEYDQVIQRQRELIYESRNRLLDGGALTMEEITRMARANIRRFLNEEREPDRCAVNRYILDRISYRLEEDTEALNVSDPQEIENLLMKQVQQRLAEQEQKLGSREGMNEFVRVAVLNAIDNAWVEQVDYLQQLQAAVSGRASAQRNLLFEYQDEAFASFLKMKSATYENAVRNILQSSISIDSGNKLHIIFP